MSSGTLRILSLAAAGVAVAAGGFAVRGGKSFARSQPVLQITSPTAGTVVNPGQTVTVIVAASGATFQAVGIMCDTPLGCDLVLSSPPYRFPVKIPASAQIAAGTYTLNATGVISPGQSLDSPNISMDVEPATAITAIRLSTKSITFQEVVGKSPLMVWGTFADGSVMDITKSSRTTYSSGNPKIATVSSTGVVTAVGHDTMSATPVVINYADQTATAHATVQVSTRLLPPDPAP